MAFKGITFAGQNVTPKDDGALYQAHYGDGILDGCSMAISGDDLVIQSGHFIAGGRVCHVDGATNVDLSGRGLTTGYIQVIMNYDLSQGEGSQWYTTFVESATTTFPALTQDDINGSDTLYQMQLAIVQISGGNLTTISETPYPSRVLYNRGASQLVITGFDDYKSILSSHNSVTHGGVAFDDTGSYPQTEIFANNGRIMLRPSGQGVGTNQVYIDRDGQFRGGFHYYAGTGSQSTATGNAMTTIKTITGLPTESGMYIFYCYIGATPASGTSNTIYTYIYDNNQGRGTTTYYEASATRHHIRYVLPYVGTPSSSTWTLRVQSAVNLSDITAQFECIRIN